MYRYRCGRCNIRLCLFRLTRDRKVRRRYPSGWSITRNDGLEFFLLHVPFVDIFQRLEGGTIIQVDHRRCEGRRERLLYTDIAVSRSTRCATVPSDCQSWMVRYVCQPLRDRGSNISVVSRWSETPRIHSLREANTVSGLSSSSSSSPRILLPVIASRPNWCCIVLRNICHNASLTGTIHFRPNR